MVQLTEITGSKGAVRQRVSAAEWEARVELAMLCRLTAHFRMTDTIYTHISLRVPDQPDCFLLNPFGLLYEEITASNLLKVDEEGHILEDETGLGINYAGFIIHGAIHAARPEVNCVLHTHTSAGTAVSAQAGGLLPLSQQAQYFYGRIGYHDHEGVAADLDERQRLVADIGEANAMILRNHGLLVAGQDAGEAMWLILMLERACQVQIAAQAGGGPLNMPSAHAVAATQQVIDRGDRSKDWQAMRRLAERIAPDLRD
jgi:ribulose-5-phosphate 4-epimerase/fuculose-1-phosphate aldolase